MPFLWNLRKRTPAVKTRVFVGLVASVTVQRQFVGLMAVVATSKARRFVGLPASVRTVDHAAHLPIPAGAEGSAAYIVAHTGLPLLTTDYSISMNADNSTTSGNLKKSLPKLEATVRGKVRLTGDIRIGVVVAKGGEVYQQVYGPFGVMGYTHNQTPTGWTTRISSLDPSAADADADGPLMLPFTEEFLPWERERDLTSYQQAVKNRQDALAQRQADALTRQRENDLNKRMNDPKLTPEALAGLRAQLKALNRNKPQPDRRKVPVQDVLNYLLSQYPYPFVLAGPLPFAKDYFWASEDTGFAYRGGYLKGVSFPIKGKTVQQALEELLNPIGWQIVVRFGVAYIGPPEELEAQALTPGYLEVPTKWLTSVSEEIVNPNVDTTGGNASLPREATIDGATAILKLPPLPPEALTDADQFAQSKNAVLNEEGRDIGVDQNGAEQVVATWRRTSTKWDDLLRSEIYEREGLVPGDGALGTAWGPIERRETYYSYGDPLYPKAETLQEVKAWGIAPFYGWQLLEWSITTTEWNDAGWMSRKTTVSRKYSDFIGIFAGGDPNKPTSKVDVSVDMQQWTSINADTWRLLEWQSSGYYHTLFSPDGTPDNVYPGMQITSKSTLTDQGPSRAPDSSNQASDSDDEDADGYPYDDVLSLTVYPGGRADPVTRAAPWATEIDPRWADWVIAGIRRARPAQRTTYQMPIPPNIEVGTKVKDFKLSGKAASVDASATIEEEISDV